MYIKKLTFAVIGLVFALGACHEDNTENSGESGTQPNDPVEYSFTVSDPGTAPLSGYGTTLIYTDGTLMSGSVIGIPANTAPSSDTYNFTAVADPGKTADKILVFSPYNQDISVLPDGNTAGQVIYAVQKPSPDSYDADADIAAGISPVSSQSPAVSLTPLATPIKLTISGLEAGEKLRSLRVTGSENLSGLALINHRATQMEIERFYEDKSGKMITATYPGGYAAEGSMYTVNLLGGPSTHSSLVFRAITDQYVVTGEATGEVVFRGTSEIPVNFDFSANESREKALTFDFIKSDGSPAAEIDSDKFQLMGSTGVGNYSFEASQCAIESGRGLRLNGDVANPGTVTIPNIEEQQISKIILLLDTSTGSGLHSLWLESYDGTVWNKIDGTDKSISQDIAARNGGFVEFVLPRTSVSALGKFRIAKAVGKDHTYIRSMTLVHEDETCSHDPASLVSAGFASGWSKAGTGSNPTNNFDRDICIVVDKDVSHVDDGTGSLRIGQIDCTNNFKPWLAWRFKDMDVTGGATYKISVCIKTVDMPASANVYLGIQFKDRANQWMTGWVPGHPDKNAMDQNTSLWVDKVKGTHDWIKLSAEMTFPEGAAKLSYFQVRVDGIISAPTACAWFDDIQVVKMND